MVPNQENMEGDQPVQSYSHSQQSVQLQTCVQEHCPGETGLPSSVFQAVSEMSLVLLFKVLKYLSSVSLSGRKQCSWCQISLCMNFSAHPCILLLCCYLCEWGLLFVWMGVNGRTHLHLEIMKKCIRMTRSSLLYDCINQVYNLPQQSRAHFHQYVSKYHTLRWVPLTVISTVFW